MAIVNLKVGFMGGSFDEKPVSVWKRFPKARRFFSRGRVQPSPRFQTRADCGLYGMSSQVSFRDVSSFCPPKTITWPNAGKYVIPAPSRGGGDWFIRNCFQNP